MNRINHLIASWSLLGLLLVAASVRAEIVLHDTAGQTRSAAIVAGAEYVAVPLTEGSGATAGVYSATDDEINAAADDAEVTLANNLTTGYLVTFWDGTAVSGTLLPGVGARLRWKNAAEYDPLVYLDAPVSEAGGGVGGSDISPFLVDEDDTWTFDDYSQTTSKKILEETQSPNIAKSMDFTRPASKWGSLKSITSVTIADVEGATKPTVTSSTISTDQHKVDIVFNCGSATVTKYLVTVTAVSTDDQVLIRKGWLKIN